MQTSSEWIEVSLKGVSQEADGSRLLPLTARHSRVMTFPRLPAAPRLRRDSAQ